MKQRVKKLAYRISMKIFDREFELRVEKDCISGQRVFIQIQYNAPCSKTNIEQSWSGRKWYLSDHMTDDEIVKTIYTAFEAAVKHEIMEGFCIDGKVLFNPHLNFEELIKISHKEVKRKQLKQTI